ncbi:MAG: hypothetical protein ACRD0D_08820 [Acidimicrobiales bacterium]
MAMRIAVQQVGGVFGVNRQVVLDGERLTVSEDGKARSKAKVSAADREEIGRLAAQVAEAGKAMSPSDGDAADRRATTIEIDDGEEHCSVEVASTDDAPLVIWDLIDALDRVSAGPAAK